MSDSDTALGAAFIELQRQRLVALRAELFGREDRSGANERAMQELHGGEAHEYEDGAQDLTRKDVLQALHEVDEIRHQHIERALQKIVEGTYGYSDSSGKRIAQARLEANPEATSSIEDAERDEIG